MHTERFAYQKKSFLQENFERIILKHQQKILRIPCQKASAVILFVMFCILEAFSHEHTSSKKIRRLWWTLSATVFLSVGLISPIGYLYTTRNVSVSVLMYMAAATSAAVHILLVTPVTTKTYHSELTAVLENINNDFDYEPLSEEFIIKSGRTAYNTISQGIKWFVFLTLLLIPFILISYLHVKLFCDQSCLSDPRVYLLVIPNLDRIHSFKLYTFIQVISSLLLVFMFLIGGCMTLFYTIIAYEYHNAYLHFCAHVHNIIHDTTSNLRAAHEERSLTESKEFLEFEEKLASIVKHYRLLTSSLANIKPHAEISFSLNLTGFLLIQVSLSYIISLAENSIIFKIKMIQLFILICTTFYNSCYFGKLCEEMNTMVIEEVYFTQWYELPPKYRKMILLFQCQIQRPLQFKVFRMYSLNLNSFTKALRLVYSILNMLRSNIRRL